MAYLTNTICDECHEEFFGDKFSGLSVCPKCTAKAAEDKKSKHFAELDKLSLEERIRKLEEAQYGSFIVPPQYVYPPKY